MYESCVVNIEKSEHHNKIEQIRKRLKKDNNLITINDLGAGSRVAKTNERKISQIAKFSLKSAKEAQFLSCFTKKAALETIIELGSSLGLTTARIALDNPKSKIYSIEGSENIAKIAKTNLKELGVKNASIHIGNFDDIFPELLQKLNADLIFIDGNHTKDATLRYFNMALDKINPTGYMVFDDIYWSEGMTEAWKTIIANPKVSLSINLFHLGIISVNPDFSKQDFVLMF